MPRYRATATIFVNPHGPPNACSVPCQVLPGEWFDSDMVPGRAWEPDPTDAEAVARKADADRRRLRSAF